jgi:DNA-binding HxlR family transcriptional regulator
LRSLANGPLHFGELKKQVPGIPGKSLTRVLARLRQDGLILRTASKVRHVYTLARKDRLLLDIVRVLTQWGLENSTLRARRK